MLAAIRQWVIKTMTKGQTGVVTTMPKPQLIEMNVQITAERLMRNGINPEDLKTVGQVENVINQIDTPKVNVNPGVTKVKEADVMDMKGNKIDTSKGIMGGEEIKPIDELENYTKSKEDIVQDLVDRKFGKGYFDTVDESEAAIKARIEADNKKGIKALEERVKKNKEYQDLKKSFEDPEEKADGGRIGLLAGTVPKVLKLLKNKKKVQAAVDDIFPTGDYKYDAQMAADALVENNPNTFGGKLYEDLDLDTQMEVYGAVLQPITNNMAKQMQLKKATRPEKTLASMKEGKGIDMSDPGISEEFTRFMKETDPEGYKKLEQTVELSNFDPKGRKKNSDGGRIGLKGGAFLNFIKNMTMNKKSPYQFGKDYLKNVKDKTLKANETGKFMDLPIAEVGIPATTGALVNNQVKKKLEAMNEEQKEENLKRFIMELENDEFYQKYPDLKDETIASYIEKLFGEKKADGGRIGYAGGSDMGTVSGATRSANTGLKGGYQNTGTGPVERTGGGDGPSGPPKVITRTVTKPDVKNKIRRVGNTIGDISYFKNLINFNPLGIAKNVGGKILMDKILGDESSLNTEDGYDFSDIKNQKVDVSAADINRLINPVSKKPKYSSSQDVDDIRMFEKAAGFEFNPTITDQEIRDVLDKKIIRPTGQFAADGGRIGYKAGSVDKMRRLFLKTIGASTAGIAGAKSGIFSFGKGAGKEVAKEVAQQTTSSMPPPYFFKLAEKIKMLGDDATATTDRTIAKTLKSNDGKSTYLLEEDVATGDTIIKKINKEGDEMITDVEIMELKKGEVVMGKDGKPIKVPDEYEEVTETNARIEGDVFNDPYYTDGIQVDDIIKEVDNTTPSIKYASGGLAYMLGE